MHLHIFGGADSRMQRQAAKLLLTAFEQHACVAEKITSKRLANCPLMLENSQSVMGHK